MTVNFKNLDATKVRSFVWFMSKLPVRIETLVIRDLYTPKLLSTENMFRDSHGLMFVDIGDFETSNLSVASRMFRDCSELETVIFRSTETWRLLQVDEMFSGCKKLKNIDLPAIIPDGSSLRRAEYMFINCYNLSYLDFSAFNINDNTITVSAFRNCTNLFKYMDDLKMPENEQSAELIASQLLSDDQNSD